MRRCGGTVFGRLRFITELAGRMTRLCIVGDGQGAGDQECRLEGIFSGQSGVWMVLLLLSKENPVHYLKVIS